MVEYTPLQIYLQADQLKKMSDGSGSRASGSDNSGGLGGPNKQEAISGKCVIQ